MTIYTAIFGPYENLKEPLVKTEGWEYICYTDQPLKSRVWDIRYVVNVGDNVKTARECKINWWTRFDKSIWIDGSFTINCFLNKFWEKYFKSPFTAIKHPIRNCAYQEAATCIRNHRGNPEEIQIQIEKYRQEGLPIDNGLIQSGIILRENTKEVREFCDLWWEQISLSTRDQLGFAYSSWKMPIVNYIEGFDYRFNQDLIFTTHYHRRNKRTRI